MRRAVVIGFSAVALMMMGCSGGEIGASEGASNPAETDTASDLLIDENSATVTRGRLVTAAGEVSFWATDNAGTTILKVQINGKTFEVTIDGSVTIDGHEGVLTTVEKELLGQLGEKLAARALTVATGSSRIDGLATLGSYLAQAPAGYVHRRLVNGIELPEGVAAVSNTIVTCMPKGVVAVATYTNKAGVTVRGTVLTGSNWGKNAAGTSGDYSCMGLCGGGCSGTKYTQDCLNHDTCSHDMNSSGGGADTHGCSDEYGLASDDMFGACKTTLDAGAKADAAGYGDGSCVPR